MWKKSGFKDNQLGNLRMQLGPITDECALGIKLAYYVSKQGD
jgi:hypothetical protein